VDVDRLVLDTGRNATTGSLFLSAIWQMLICGHDQVNEKKLKNRWAKICTALIPIDVLFERVSQRTTLQKKFAQMYE
jgi:hypothetical protein